jgi:hypothetical protein
MSDAVAEGLQTWASWPDWQVGSEAQREHHTV